MTQFSAAIATLLIQSVLRWCEESGDGFAEEVFEQARGGRAERAVRLAAGESLKVAQAEGARFVMVAGEGFGVVDELLVGHAPLLDALGEQGAG